MIRSCYTCGTETSSINGLCLNCSVESMANFTESSPEQQDVNRKKHQTEVLLIQKINARNKEIE